MNKLLSFMTLLTTVTGCGDCEPVSLTPSEQAWVSAYQPGQRLTFRSNRGATNVFTVQPLTEFHDNQNCNQFEAGKYQPIRTTLSLASATDYGGTGGAGFSLLAYKIRPTYPAQLTFTLGGLLCQATDPPGSSNPRLVKLLPQAVTLASGRSYPEAQLIRSGEQGTIHMGTSQLRAAWWDRQAGLLRYELASGEVFDLTAE